MKIIFKAKKLFYILCILAILLLSMSQSGIMGKNNMIYSVFDAIQKCSEAERAQFTIQYIFACGSSSFWFYLVIPVVAAIPVASFISDEGKNRFYLYEKMRGGTFRYLCSRLTYMLVSCAVILFIGLGIYMLILCQYFNLEAVYPEGVASTVDTAGDIRELAHYCISKYGYLLAYSYAISLFTSLLVLLYNDLFFDISLAFILNYLFKDWFLGDKIIYPLLLIGFLLIPYLLLWKKGKNL